MDARAPRIFGLARLCGGKTLPETLADGHHLQEIHAKPSKMKRQIDVAALRWRATRLFSSRRSRRQRCRCPSLGAVPQVPSESEWRSPAKKPKPRKITAGLSPGRS